MNIKNAAENGNEKILIQLKKADKLAKYFLTFICCFVTFMEFGSYFKTKYLVNSNKYLEVTGEVADFESSNYDSFTINGIEFSISDVNVLAGYDKTSRNGGAVYKNGQKLYVKYVKRLMSDEAGIVYIGEIE